MTERATHKLVGRYIVYDDAQDGELMGCGHPVSAVASGDEGTNHCSMCAFACFEAEAERVAGLDAQIAALRARVAELEGVNAEVRAAVRREAYEQAVDALNGAIGDVGVRWPLRGVMDYAYELVVIGLMETFVDAEDDSEALQKWRDRSTNGPNRKAYGRVAKASREGAIPEYSEVPT